MKKFHSILRRGSLLIALLVTFAGVLQSCDDEDPAAPTSFAIEGEPTGITSGSAGKTESFVVRARGAWQVVAQDESDWVKAFPTEGEDDGIFKIIVSANKAFEPRTANFAFVINGEEQPVLLRVEQEAAVPTLTIPADMVIQSAGGDVIIDLKSNVDWTYTLSDDSWLTEVTKSTDKITFNAAVNKGGARSVTMSIVAPDYPEFSGSFTLEQLPGNIVLNEDFNWLAYGNAIPYETGGEKRYDQWAPEEQAKGWTSTVNTVPESGNTPMLYARQGFVKLGKTKYGGDLISPKLVTIEDTKNLKVTFKAAAYISENGTIDSRELVIEILGAGTPSTSSIMIENIPNYRAQDDDGIENDIWAADRAFTFNITDATADTQIRFIGKAFDLRNATPNKNRIFLDDIKVEVVD